MKKSVAYKKACIFSFLYCLFLRLHISSSFFFCFFFNKKNEFSNEFSFWYLFKENTNEWVTKTLFFEQNNTFFCLSMI